MQGNKEYKLRQMVSQLIQQLANEEAKGNQLFEVRLLPFSTSAQVWGPWPASAAAGQVERLNTRSPFGQGTALIDAIGKALESFNGKTPAIIAIFSDGQEMHSTIYSASRLKAAVAIKEATGNLTLTFAGPDSARHMLRNIGLPEGNFQSWDGSERAMQETVQRTTSSMDNYIQDRSKGVTRSARFYADPGDVSVSAVRGMTKKVTPSEVRKVTAKMDGRAISDFYGSKFDPGNHYYELVKPEYIQDGKELVILVKSSNEYRLGSRAVRSLLGLPETGKVRVHPGPHNDKYQIFVQSSSMNRKVVEGQTMITVK